MQPRCCRPVAGRQIRGGCIIPQAVTHILVLLKMGKIIFPKYIELTGIINKPLLLNLVGCLYYLYFIIFFWDLLNILYLPLSWKRGEYGKLLILPANGRWDLIRRLEVKIGFLLFPIYA